MRPTSMTERFLQSIWVTVVARATMLAMPLVVSFVTWFTWNIYSDIRDSIKEQRAQIIEIKTELQEHKFRLDAEEEARSDLAVTAEKHFANIDTHLDTITTKLTDVSDSVIRVQTIIETRLPTKEGKLQWPQQ